MRRAPAILLALAALCLSVPVSAEPISVDARRIDTFKPGLDNQRFGRLEFLGGLELSSTEPLFGAWSSIRFLDDQSHFIGVLDTGHWLEGRIDRGSDGRLSGLSEVSLSPMADQQGRFMQGKYLMDAESLALRDDGILVGFEQRHRIDVYPREGFTTARPTSSLPLPFPTTELRRNGGLETVVVSPVDTPLAGATITIAERSVDGDGNLFAGIVDGSLQGAFRVARHDSYDVTDGAFLPNGDLMLLERRFSLATGIGMRIRLVAGDTIKPGAIIDGEVLLDADFGYQIDNMEGLDVIKAADGTTHIIVVSDDNHSILQRNLMLEFRLNDER